MAVVDLAYGRTSFNFEFDDSAFAVLNLHSGTEKPLSDLEIGAAFDAPIDSPPLDEIVSADDTVLIVVSDATRATGSPQIVNLLVRRLLQCGVSPANAAVIFATGIHRPVTANEKVDLLSPFIVQRLRTLDHNAFDSDELISVGTTDSGVPVELNRALREFSRVIIISGIAFHYFAGFTGSRKSICPGLASAKTIEATHMLALDFEKGGRRAGVGTGQLVGNAVHEECERIASMVNPAFVINTIIDDKHRVVEMFCGNWRSAHLTACNRYLTDHSLAIPERRNLVIVSCGGFPYDINLIQAHKALDMAAYACEEGGSIILLAECRDGLGRPDFLKWFTAGDSPALEKQLRDAYEVNGQTAWALLSKAERHRVVLISELADEDVKTMCMTPARTLADALIHAGSATNGYIMPRGAAVLPRVLT
jgi:nickel-dependent lactate racemase